MLEHNDDDVNIARSNQLLVPHVVGYFLLWFDWFLGFVGYAF